MRPKQLVHPSFLDRLLATSALLKCWEMSTLQHSRVLQPEIAIMIVPARTSDCVIRLLKGASQGLI